MRNLTILGATGSIGSSTLKILREHPYEFRLHAVAASVSVEKMVDIVREFHPDRIAMFKPESANVLARRLKDENLYAEVLSGESGVIDIASDGMADIVVAAVVGAAGLRPILAAVKTGCVIALANKESLVMSGKLFFEQVEKYHAKVLPVDSEHSAIFQCLPYEIQTELGHCDLKQYGVSKILLTGSGGPFLHLPLEELEKVTPTQAVSHPIWSMGPKISVDSATMMNKGLEFIEARYLFNAKDEDIKVLIHPQSVVHSMVAYRDGAVLAQLGKPDMCTPIAVALGFPNRISSTVEPLDFEKVGTLSFASPDYERYPCLKLAMQASLAGQGATTTLNAANEVAVANFLNGNINYKDIARVCNETLQSCDNCEAHSLDEIFQVDERARQLARIAAGKLSHV